MLLNNDIIVSSMPNWYETISSNDYFTCFFDNNYIIIYNSQQVT